MLEPPGKPWRRGDNEPSMVLAWPRDGPSLGFSGGLRDVQTRAMKTSAHLAPCSAIEWSQQLSKTGGSGRGVAGGWCVRNAATLNYAVLDDRGESCILYILSCALMSG